MGGHQLTRGLFLRALAVTHIVALGSLYVQIDGLVGPQGILPAEPWLEAVRARLGDDAAWRVPTLCWVFGASPAALRGLCIAGFALAALVLSGIAQAPALLGLWAIYLSLSAAFRTFLNFQWDTLLLETTLLAFLFAPWHLHPRRAAAAPPSRIALWLLRLLAAKLMFMSGVVKLTSNDPVWRDLTALTYHYWTTCLPVWPAWYVHQLPLWVHQASCVAMFATELVLPFFVFGPRLLRLVAALAFTGLMAGIALTGNYGFFNVLAVALCLPLLDDAALLRLLPRRLRPGAPPRGAPPRRTWWRATPIACVALIWLGASALQMVGRIGGTLSIPEWGLEVLDVLHPLRSVNGYGLFANMTTERTEIVIEGSNDGQTWLPYEFKWKPGDPARRPAFVQPHMPRLDWQMWFAALGSPRSQPWFLALMRRLQEGSPPVLALLASNPFPEAPPRLLRAQRYAYRFADPAQRARGQWWQRELTGAYTRVLGD
jgi:hypothetical protein